MLARCTARCRVAQCTFHFNRSTSLDRLVHFRRFDLKCMRKSVRNHTYSCHCHSLPTNWFSVRTRVCCRVCSCSVKPPSFDSLVVLSFSLLSHMNNVPPYSALVLVIFHVRWQSRRRAQVFLSPCILYPHSVSNSVSTVQIWCTFT